MECEEERHHARTWSSEKWSSRNLRAMMLKVRSDDQKRPVGGEKLQQRVV
jgi:hypothetical protein